MCDFCFLYNAEPNNRRTNPLSLFSLTLSDGPPGACTTLPRAQVCQSTFNISSFLHNFVVFSQNDLDVTGRALVWVDLVYKVSIKP